MRAASDGVVDPEGVVLNIKLPGDDEPLQAASACVSIVEPL